MISSIIAIAISAAALVFSVFTWRERRHKDQRDLFFRINESLVNVELQRGRRIIYRTIRSEEDVKNLYHDNPDDYDLANRALAMLNVSALYVKRGYIDREIFTQEWGHVYARIWQHAKHFISFRKKDSFTPDLWPHFQSFAEQAAASVDGKTKLIRLDCEPSAQRNE